MNEAEFDRFMADCVARLQHKQDALQASHGLSRHERWHFDEHTGVLSFLDAGGEASLRFATTPIGTFSSTQETWKWAWANGHVHLPLRQRAEALKNLAGRTDYQCFIDEDAFAVDAGMAWELAAAGVEQLGALGCYRAPHRETWLFLALDEQL